MENCDTTNYSGLGYGALPYIRNPEFIQARNQILSRITALKEKTLKEEFRKECLELSNYLIKLKNKPPKYTNPKQWVPVLRNYFKSKFDELTEHGGCPMIFEQNERDLLELKHDALDYCETIKVYEKKLRAFKKGDSSTYNCNSDADCIRHCTEYKDWFTSKNGHFQNTRNLISKSCIFKHLSSHFPTKKCNILNTRMLNKVPECLCIKPEATSQPSYKEKKLNDVELDQNKSEDALISQDQSLQQMEHPPDGPPHRPTERQPDSSPESSSSDPSQLLTKHEDKSMANSDNLGADTQHTHPEITPANTHLVSTKETIQTSTFQPPFTQELQSDSDLKVIPASYGALISEIHPSTPVDHKIQGNINSTFFSIFYALMGKIKKKKYVRRRQVKFLRILLPSHSVKKDIFLSDNHLDQPIYDDEEIIKKLKIHEHKTMKNTNLFKRKKDRSKTIIEVHMEVLEEFRNLEWELNKGEFLELCIEVFANEEYRSYPNLINYDQMENIKYSTDIEEKKILWNKWIERHENFSEILKKADWFNNLKNEWKKEKGKVKEMQELNKKCSNVNQKVSFLEKEKDIWRQWISSKVKTIEQYLEQDWFKEFTDEFNNIPDEYKNEETKNSVSLINIEELEHNKNCEELYKYVKKKLLEKLCILVFMMILEECIKEERIENKESYFDNSINECKLEENSDRNKQIIEHIMETNCNILESRRNKKIHDNKRQECFSENVEDWIKEDDSFSNSTLNKNVLDKSNDFREKYFL
ncbi:STP1 protein [Plasmodium brasilianum]|uniref:STP1 protein n=1 Tax=Plasmodium brasilianum TaxID=5824 RepID=A0ACB9YAR2_PLABR|nr:STP1 protein [Plasmodium brasilianum]